MRYLKFVGQSLVILVLVYTKSQVCGRKEISRRLPTHVNCKFIMTFLFPYKMLYQGQQHVQFYVLLLSSIYIAHIWCGIDGKMVFLSMMNCKCWEWWFRGKSSQYQVELFIQNNEWLIIRRTIYILKYLMPRCIFSPNHGGRANFGRGVGKLDWKIEAGQLFKLCFRFHGVHLVDPRTNRVQLWFYGIVYGSHWSLSGSDQTNWQPSHVELRNSGEVYKATKDAFLLPVTQW